MKKLQKKQAENMNTLQAQAFCICAGCYSSCSCYGQPDNVFKSTQFNQKWATDQASYKASKN